MDRRHFIPLLLPALAFAQECPYENRTICGWNVTVSRKLLTRDTATANQALKLLETKLLEIEAAIPAEALKSIKRVGIWMEHPDEGVAKCAAYHPSEKWLTDRGHHPGKTRCVEFGNPSLFVQWSETQPSMVLHELAHAYHHQVLIHGYGPVNDAFEAAVKSGIYEGVQHANGKTRRAYALNNQKEFFAELTEAYFGRNDFFPFEHNELKEYDPVGFEAVKGAWKA